MNPVRLALCAAFVLACDKPAPPAPAASSASPSASVAALPASTEEAKPPPKPQAAPDWITAQHILVAYKGAKSAPRNVTRSKDDARKRAEEALAKIKEGKMEFADVAQMYSDDEQSRARMGSVGKITRSSVVKEFADVAFALKVEEVSGLVETPFGFHVIKRNQ